MISVQTTTTEVKTKFDIQFLLKELEALSENRVLVGVPSEKASRTFSVEEWENREKTPIKDLITNAELARIHDLGSPRQNIPARQFMKPGIAKAQNRINAEFKAAVQAKLNGNEEEMKVRLHRAGLIAQNSIRNIIRIGEGFEPLKRATLLARTRKRAYAWHQLSKEQMQGASKAQKRQMRGEKREAIMSSMHPLQDTLQMLKSISYVVEGGT
jgi:hypothetical protein